MALTVAFQMDPMGAVDINADSTFALALSAQERGHQLYHYEVADLSFEDGQVRALAQSMTLQRVEGDHVQFGPAAPLDLASVDVVWMRQDPPFDMGYITAAMLLEKIHPETLVVNAPLEVVNAPEKLFVTEFADLIPPTLISRSVADIKAFRAKHKDIIIKPLYGNGGAGVFRVTPEDQNFNTILEMFFERNREPVIAQAYLPAVRQGDKRIILVDGVAAGAINRVPAEGEARSNLHVGGRAEAIGLSARDQEICDRIGPVLKERGFIFVGIDVIGDYLTEINVTSPTGLQEIDRFDGSDLPGQIWDAIEAKIPG